MSKKVYVYSTLTSDHAYTTWTKGPNDLPIRNESVLIKGGSNVADKNLFTPYGVVTTITQDQYERAKLDPVFQRHVDNGFISVQEHKEEVPDVVSDMVGRDESAPLVPEDFTTKGQEPPVVNGKSEVPKPPKR